MTKEEIIKALRDMARYPTVTLPRDSEALKVAADLLAQPDPYAKGYADAMNWKVQNHLEHLPAAQPEQEAVAWMNDMGTHIDLNVSGRGNPLYIVPPQRTWVGLTDEEINDIAKNYALNNPTTPLHFARAIEAKLKERNHEN